VDENKTVNQVTSRWG